VSDALVNAIAREFDDFPPAELLGPVVARLPQSARAVDIETIVAVLVDDSATLVRNRASAAFRRWDAESVTAWTSGTTPNTDERRGRIYWLLGIPAAAHQPLTAEFPIVGGPTVIAAPYPWEPWYLPERRQEHNFYWRAYRSVLDSKGWDEKTIGGLDVATTEVVQRLADPTRSEPYQSKGLVVGYVQSGKTANFSGVIAKAIDAGYRLVIVLTGTIEILRSQTQRRLDMELIGRQNIDDADYAGDDDWLNDRFLVHEVDPNKSDVPAIRRLTGASDDYKALAKGLSALHYEFVDHSAPLTDPKNLHRSNVRMAVVKKNSTVLKKLVADLGRIPTDLEQIPTLIIDDEADQASVNTINPKKFTEDRIERTAINAQISELLDKLKRAQYVGYTATPFANVFVDPDDSVNIFPNDFIVSLERPSAYMGGADFHDLEGDLGVGVDKTPANSNEKAYVRDLHAQSEEEQTAERLLALDSFVLAGAIKLFRQERGNQRFKHHTMLVHESVKQAEHRALAEDFKALWRLAGYSQPSGLMRLQELWTNDFQVVCQARADRGTPVPATFEELETFIGDAYGKISDGISPVIIVNGEAEKDYTQEALDFQEQGVWKILVGGAKLSRGFTVEGLTTTYYTRRTAQADTLMQMGRWFGFRPGYRDLVRLFIGRAVSGPLGREYDMYEAFEAIVEDEEDFRAELERFKGLNAGGEPMVTPRDIPPMVFQQLPWLKPTSANKMYNAELNYRGVGGQSFSFTMQPPRGDGSNNVKHFNLIRPWLEQATSEGQFNFQDKDGKTRVFDAKYGIVSASAVLDVVAQFVWDENWSFDPHRKAFESAIDRGMLDDFVVLLPQPKTRTPIFIEGWDTPLPIVNRKRQEREYRTGFTGTAVRERDAIEDIAGSPDKNGGPLAKELHKPTRGALILLFASDPGSTRHIKKARSGPADPRDIATLFSYALPFAAEPTPKVGFTVRRSGAGAIVDAK
jgi:hypothetical protein